MLKKCRLCKKISPVLNNSINPELALHLTSTHGIFAHSDRKVEKLTAFIIKYWIENAEG